MIVMDSEFGENGGSHDFHFRNALTIHCSGFCITSAHHESPMGQEVRGKEELPVESCTLFSVHDFRNEMLLNSAKGS